MRTNCLEKSQSSVADFLLNRTIETLVYSKQIDEARFGLARPEYIGWIGGVEAKTTEGSRLILAFSGMRGEQDVSILKKAAENLKSFSIQDW